MIRALGNNQRILLEKLAAPGYQPISAGSLSGVAMTDVAAMASMKALETRGLVKRIARSGSNSTWGTRWVITPAGRARLDG